MMIAVRRTTVWNEQRGARSSLRLQCAILFILVIANLLSSQQRNGGNWLREIVVSRSLQSHFVPLSSTSIRHETVNVKTKNNSSFLSLARQLPSSSHSSAGAVHDHTSWIGNQWIPPPGFRLHSVEEMQHFFLSQPPPVLFLGDSSARRVYATFFAVLNTTTSHDNNMEIWDLDAAQIIDVNKNAVTEVCTTRNVTLCRRVARWDQHNRNNIASTYDDSHLDYQQVTCPETILAMDFDRLVRDYTVIIIHLGAWHLMMKCRSKRMDDFRQLLWKLESYQRANLTIVWVTMGSVGHEHDINGKRTFKRALEINTKIRQHVEEARKEQQQNFDNSTMMSPAFSLTVLDWGSVVQPRSWPFQDRIHGDIAPHYGLEARLVLIQILMNHLLALQHRR